MILNFLILILINYNLCNKTINNIKNNFINETYMYTSYSQTLNNNKRINNKKNLIMGVISKYSLNQILPFFNSFKRSHFENCDIVMFVRYIAKNTIDYLQSNGVIVHIIPEIYKKVGTINLRWKMYIDFLKDKKNKYNLIFSADVRDIFFQKDIFKYYENHKPFLGVAIEDGTNNQWLNRQWIIDYAGLEKQKLIKNERVICVGTIWGTYKIFLDFCKVFWKRLIENPKYIEQGIANYMFYYDKLFGDLLVKSDNFGPVMTIGLTKRQNIVLDQQNNILNFAGEIASVIHQYDRKRDIVEKVIKKYCPEIIYFNNNINKNNLKKVKQRMYKPEKIYNSSNSMTLNITENISEYYNNIFFL